jgi:hypothetical protein
MMWFERDTACLDGQRGEGFTRFRKDVEALNKATREKEHLIFGQVFSNADPFTRGKREKSLVPNYPGSIRAQESIRPESFGVTPNILVMVEGMETGVDRSALWN